MAPLDELAAATPPRDSYITVGVFDGVHLGHRHLFDALVGEAAKAGCLAGVVTFRNHPGTVLVPGTVVPAITTVEEQVRFINEMGIDFVVPTTFTLEVSKMTAAEFVSLLQRHLRMRGLVVGPDFALGHHREGTPEVLKELGRKRGFSVSVVEPFTLDGHIVNSTAIRTALAQGDVQTAFSLLGRPYILEGTVVHGDQRGGSVLDYPTANVQAASGMMVPGDGIYATWAHFGGQRYKAATSIGVRPTFGSNERTVEAFILDYHGDLYNKGMKLEFVRYLRAEVAFESVEKLKEQMDRDVEQVRQVLDQ
ncbi:MAG: bifunctional riboflavin kinase/FAD synthetase [Chloroflexi bacterium]|nr:bifunctional riboflavin kinase/FAD synthetase [Chloroflexota bacterium]